MTQEEILKLYTSFETSTKLKELGFDYPDNYQCWYQFDGDIDPRIANKLRGYLHPGENLCEAYNAEFLIDKLPNGAYIKKCEDSYSVNYDKFFEHDGFYNTFHSILVEAIAWFIIGEIREKRMEVPK